MLVRGHKMSGLLTRFLPSHGVVEFLPARGRVNIEVSLADILQLRLTRPIVYRPRATELEQRASVSPCSTSTTSSRSTTSTGTCTATRC